MKDSYKPKDPTWWNEVRKLKKSIDHRPTENESILNKKTTLKIQTNLTDNFNVQDAGNSDKNKDLNKDKDFEQTLQKLQRLRRHNNDLPNSRMFYSVASNQNPILPDPLRTCEDKKKYDELSSPFSAAAANNSVRHEQENSSIAKASQTNDIKVILENDSPQIEDGKWKINFLESVMREAHIVVDYDKKTWFSEDSLKDSTIGSKKTIMELKKQIKAMERNKEKEMKELEDKHKEDIESVKAQYESKLSEMAKENDLISGINQQHEIDLLNSQIEDYVKEIERLKANAQFSPGSRGTSVNIRTASKEKLDDIVSE
jgi:hypothetical protein